MPPKRFTGREGRGRFQGKPGRGGAGRGSGKSRGPITSKATDPKGRQKWTHHCLKVLGKVLKKAKDFEVKKINRRIAETKSKGDAPEDQASTLAKLTLAKLNQQLELAKAVDVTPLANILARKSGLLEDSSCAEATTAGDQCKDTAKDDASSDGGGEDAAQTRCGTNDTVTPGELAASLNKGASQLSEVGRDRIDKPSGVPTRTFTAELSGLRDVVKHGWVIRQRIMRAGCVKKQIEDSLADFKKKFKPELSAEVAKADAPSAAGSDSDTEGVQDPGIAVNGAERKSVVAETKPSKKSKPEQPSAEKLMGLVRSRDDDESDDSGVIGDDAWADLEEEGAGASGSDDDRMGSDDEGMGSDDEGMGSDDDMEGSLDSAQWDQPAGGGVEVEQPMQPPSSSGRLEDSDSDDEGIENPAAAKKQAKASQASPASKRTGEDAQKEAKQNGKGSNRDAAGDKYDRKKQKMKDVHGLDPLSKKAMAMKKAKNRPGQHTRRKMAEQLYGWQARHLAQEQEKKASASNAQASSGSCASEEKLHPSWAAKRQQKPLMIEPAGKKVMFDEDGGSVVAKAPATNTGPARNGAPSFGKGGSQRRPPQNGGPPKKGPPGGPKAPINDTRGAPNKKPGDDKPLHPSWEIRKQQKAAAAARPIKPAGTKIVFDD